MDSILTRRRTAVQTTAVTQSLAANLGFRRDLVCRSLLPVSLIPVSVRPVIVKRSSGAPGLEGRRRRRRQRRSTPTRLAGPDPTSPFPGEERRHRARLARVHADPTTAHPVRCSHGANAVSPSYSPPYSSTMGTRHRAPPPPLLGAPSAPASPPPRATPPSPRDPAHPAGLARDADQQHGHP